jgi:phage baseplate assembly protein W
MSWSLQVSNGDLSFGSAGLNTVSGGQKLVQDLTCDILEPMGTDPMHPTYGSIIDGSVDANGNYQPGLIGQVNDRTTATQVGAEVQRICMNYQQSQVARNQADINVYGKSTLTADEALLTVLGVQVQQVEDQALVTATLQTGAGGLPLNVPLTS